MALLDPVFADKPGMTPQEVERRRKLAEQLLAGSKQPLTHPLQAIAEMLQGGVGAWNEHKAAKGEEAGRQHRADMIGKAFFGGTTPASTSPSLPSDLGGSPATSTAMATSPAPANAATVTANNQSNRFSGSKKDFIDMLMPGAIEASRRTGIDPRIIIAQSAQETGWGRSAPGNNYFGIKSHGKGGGQTFKTHEYVNGKRININDSFRSYGSPDESVAGYADFILQNPRYKPLMSAQGLDAQLEALQASGYATDPNYSRSVGAIARGIQIPDMAMAPSAPAPAVAALDALAGGQPPSISDGEAQAILSRPRPADAQPYSGPGSVIDPAGVAQLQQSRLEQERAANSAAVPSWLRDMVQPGQAQPLPDNQFSARFATTGGPAPEMRDGTQMPGAQEFIAERMAGFAPQQAQVNPQQQMLAQALTGATLADDRIPMAGGQLGFAPIQQMPAVSQLPQQQAMAQALTGGQQAQPAPGISPQMIQELLGNPWTEDLGQQMLGKYLDQQEKERLRLLEQQEAERQMQRRLDAAAAAGVDPRFIGDDDIWKQATGAQFREQPTDIREYEYARQQGYQGTFAEFQIEQKRAGATNVDARNMGTIPQGYRMIYDDAGNPIQMEPIPGGPADTSSEEETAANNRQVSTDIITNAAKLARQALTGPGLPATGTMGRVLSAIPETNASEVRRHVETLQAQAKIENLQAMRAASPTGGALGAVSDKENAMLAAKSGALDPDSPTFARDLDDYERTLLRIVHGPQVGDAIFEQTREAAPSKPLSEMTDEELEAIINGQ